MAWKPPAWLANLGNSRLQQNDTTATAAESDDTVLDPHDEDEAENTDTAASPAADTHAAENERLRAENTRLQASVSANAQNEARALDTSRTLAFSVAVTAFGQNTAKLRQAQTDIAACASVAEAERLQRAYAAATPAVLTTGERQTTPAANSAQSAGATRTDLTEADLQSSRFRLLNQTSLGKRVLTTEGKN